MRKLREDLDDWWMRFDFWADIAMIGLMIVCILVFFFHMRDNPPGHRSPGLIICCIGGFLVSVLYRCAT